MDSHSLKLRHLALEILRNMSFNSANRSTLLGSTDFLNTMHSTLTQNNPNDQLVATVTIWKLIAQNHKGKSIIKNSSIYGKLNRLKDQVGRSMGNKQKSGDENDDAASRSSDDETIEDLSVALQCVLDILEA